jgi:hypothetical protein
VATSVAMWPHHGHRVATLWPPVWSQMVTNTATPKCGKPQLRPLRTHYQQRQWLRGTSQIHPSGPLWPADKADGAPSTGCTADGPWIISLNNVVLAAETASLITAGRRAGYKCSSDTICCFYCCHGVFRSQPFSVAILLHSPQNWPVTISLRVLVGYT